MFQSFPIHVFEQKRGTFRRICPSLRLVQRYNTHIIEMCRAKYTRTHRLQKCIVYRQFLKYQFRDGRLQSVCQVFYSVIFFIFTSNVFSGKRIYASCNIIYTAIKGISRTNEQKREFLQSVVCLIKSGAHWWPRDQWELDTSLFKGRGGTADKSTPVYVYCRSGRRSKSAMSKLLQQGYGKVTDLGSMENAEKQLSIPR